MGRAKEIELKVIPAKIANPFIKNITTAEKLLIIVVCILERFLTENFTGF